MLREEISDKYKWDLSSVVENDERWQELFDELGAEYVVLGDFKGKLNSSDAVFDCLTVEDDISRLIERLYVYARMRRDEDANVPKYQGMTDKIENLAVKISELASYIAPELSQIPDETLRAFKSEKRFEPFDYLLENVIRNKQHILSEREEYILSGVSAFSDGFHDAFDMFDNADVRFKDVLAHNGERIEMSHGVYGMLLQSQDRDLRKQAFDSMFNAYKDMNNTLAQLYGGNVKKNAFFAKTRGFKSALEASAFHENVPSDIYRKLLNNVDKSLPLMHEYINLRKRALNLKELHCYDLHVPIAEGADLKPEYEEACAIVRGALGVLGGDYTELLDKAFSEKWIDVYENKGKKSGAYSWGSYDSHPYVLLNYKPVTHDVFTIAHELGHAMHSHYSNSSQPHAKAGYEIFVAEVASTVNEVLLLKHLMKSADDSKKKYLLSYYLDMFRTTLFRQTQFAAFEEQAHSLYESGRPITAEALNELYLGLNKRYYGDGLAHDPLIAYEWSRIPHFYRSFYVYKYATGIISAVSIAHSILTEGESAIRNYKEFLKTGGSMPPHDELKIAGIDLTADKPYDTCMKEFASTLEELESLI